MNEDLHIEKAAQLVDKPGAENLANDRAKAFVAKAMASQKKKELKIVHNLFIRKPVYAWSGVAMALAACVAIAIFLFRPSGQDGVIPGHGNPGQLIENQSIHAGTEVLDSTKTDSADTLAIESVIYPEE